MENQNKKSDEISLEQTAFYKKKAVEWLKVNKASNISSEIINKFDRELDETLKTGKSLTFILGRKLTKSGKPYMLGMGMYYFQVLKISPKTEKELQINPYKSSFAVYEPLNIAYINQPEKSQIRITDLRIPNDRLKSNMPLKGELNLEVIDPKSWQTDKHIAIIMQYVIQLPKGQSLNKHYLYCEEWPEEWPNGKNISFNFLLKTFNFDLDKTEFLQFWGTLDLQFMVCKVTHPDQRPNKSDGIEVISSIVNTKVEVQ